MKRLLATLVCLLALAAQAAPPAPVALQRPNVIFVLADDLGHADLSLYGQRQFRTPRIDRLANEGMHFTRFYAGAAVCGPSRSVLMTGQNQGQTRIRANTALFTRPDGSSYLGSEYLRQDDPTLAKLFKQAGYHTALIGKWGLGDDNPDRPYEIEGHPNRQGFDEFYGYLNHVHAHNHYPGFLWRNDRREPLRNKPVRVDCSYCDKFGFPGEVTPPAERRQFSGDLMRDEALAFLRRQKAGEPFFLYLALVEPHANNEGTLLPGARHGMDLSDYGPFNRKKDWPEASRAYARMVTQLDDTVGRVVDQLKRQHLDRDTILIFSSDNGTHAEGGYDPEFLNGSGPLRGIKRDAYEGGARAPLVVWAPGRVPAGRVSSHIGYFGDFMATFAEMLRQPMPAGPSDSVSFWPTLTGQPGQREREHLYFEFYEWGSWQAVRMQDWKALRIPLGSGPMELYDLKLDPGETRDVAADHPDIVERARALMDATYQPSAHWKPEINTRPPDRVRSRLPRLLNDTHP